MKAEKYQPGDCFEFRENIRDFGLIFLEEKTYPDGKQFNLFPVKLDTTRAGIDKFRYGKVYLNGALDMTNLQGRREGFMAYHFMFQKDYGVINSSLRHVGPLSINDAYKNVAGGTVAPDMKSFRLLLDYWQPMCETGGRLVSVNEVLK